MWREGIRGRRRRQSSAVHRPNLAAGKQGLGFPDLAKRDDAKRRWMPFPFPLPVPTDIALLFPGILLVESEIPSGAEISAH